MAARDVVSIQIEEWPGFCDCHDEQKRVVVLQPDRRVVEHFPRKGHLVAESALAVVGIQSDRVWILDTERRVVQLADDSSRCIVDTVDAQEAPVFGSYAFEDVVLERFGEGLKGASGTWPSLSSDTVKYAALSPGLLRVAGYTTTATQPLPKAESWVGELGTDFTVRWRSLIGEGRKQQMISGEAYRLPQPCGDLAICNMGMLRRRAGRIAAVDRSNGSIRWQKDLVEAITSLHATEAQTCVGTIDGAFVLDTQTGAERLFLPMEGSGPCLLAPWQGGFLCVGQRNRKVRWFSADGQKVITEVELPELYYAEPAYGFALADGILCMSAIRSGPDSIVARGLIVIRASEGKESSAVIAPRTRAEVRKEGSERDPVYVARIVDSDIYEVRRAAGIDLAVLCWRVGVRAMYGAIQSDDLDRRHKGRIIVETDLTLLPPDAEASLNALLEELAEEVSGTVYPGAGKKYAFKFELRGL